MYERQSGQVTVVNSGNDRIQLILSDAMDDAIFDYPLTLKTEVNSEWTEAEVEQNGNKQAVTPVQEGNGYFVYYDAVPDAGTITISNSAITKIIFPYIDNGKNALLPAGNFQIYDLRGRLINTIHGYRKNLLLEIKEGL
jgi:hypothetical protein